MSCALYSYGWVKNYIIGYFGPCLIYSSVYINNIDVKSAFIPLLTAFDPQ